MHDACLLDGPKNPLKQWHAGLVHLAAPAGKQHDLGLVRLGVDEARNFSS